MICDVSQRAAIGTLFDVHWLLVAQAVPENELFLSKLSIFQNRYYVYISTLTLTPSHTHTHTHVHTSAMTKFVSNTTEFPSLMAFREAGPVRYPPPCGLSSWGVASTACQPSNPAGRSGRAIHTSFHTWKFLAAGGREGGRKRGREGGKEGGRGRQCLNLLLFRLVKFRKNNFWTDQIERK